MARKSPPNPNIIDFDTGGEVVDATNSMRQAQSSLYRVDNPYIGNKRKIVVDIATSLNEYGIHFNTMADVFSGSGVVGLFFKLLGKRICSNDILTSSYMNAVAFVENTGTFLIPDEIEFLCNNHNKDASDFVRKNYAKRFTPREALFLDNYRANIETISDTVIKRAICIVMIEYYVMNRCFLGGRLNNGQILAKLEHRLEHQRNDGSEMGFRLKPLPVFYGDGCTASNMDCLAFLDSMPDVDLCYIDPPYGGDQSDYASMFAFCEEYVYGSPIASLPHLAHSKKFASKKDFEMHFREVLERSASKAKSIAVSFNDSSWASGDVLKKIISDYKKHVDVINMDYTYHYRKERDSSTEYLFIAR